MASLFTKILCWMCLHHNREVKPINFELANLANERRQIFVTIHSSNVKMKLPTAESILSGSESCGSSNYSLHVLLYTRIHTLHFYFHMLIQALMDSGLQFLCLQFVSEATLGPSSQLWPNLTNNITVFGCDPLIWICILYFWADHLCTMAYLSNCGFL